MPEGSLPKDVEEVFGAQLKPGWHVTYAFEDADGCSKQVVRGRGGPKMVGPTKLAEGTRAVLVLIEPKSYNIALHVITGISKHGTDGYELPPFVVMIFGPRGLGFNNEFLTAQTNLQKAGADDVCIKPPMDDFDVGLSSSYLRARDKIAIAAQCQNDLDDYQSCVDKLQHSLWTQAPAYIPNFPTVQFAGPTELTPLTRVGDGFTLHEQLGAGITGSVHMVRNETTGQNEAMKFIAKGNVHHIRQVKDVAREIKLLSRLEHENVVQLYDFIHTTHFLVIHMEKAGSTNLFRFIKVNNGRLQVEKAQPVTVQLVQALTHCHERCVAHGDLKPENVAISVDGPNVHAKLVDFGSAMNSSRRCRGCRGTMPFMAPEIMIAFDYAPAPADVWSLGVLVLEMLCGLRKMNRIMGWSQHAVPHPRLAEGLAHVFGQPEALRDTLEDSSVTPDRPLLAALRGALVVTPVSTRWTAAQLARSEWLANGLGDALQEDVASAEALNGSTTGLENSEGGRQDVRASVAERDSPPDEAPSFKTEDGVSTAEELVEQARPELQEGEAAQTFQEHLAVAAVAVDKATEENVGTLQGS
jgi:serine/threonine protein kinase